MTKISSVIFDLDGCLIDSSIVQKEAFFGSYEEVVGDNNCPSYEEYIKHTGNSIENVLKKLNLPLTMASHFRRISTEAVNKVIVNWEAIDLIVQLREKGWKIAICTGKDHYRTVDILNYFNIRDYFDVLVCADDVKDPKPSPQPVEKALELLECSKENSIMVGDGYSDILSARGAGVKSVLTLWYGDNGVPREADYIVKTVEDLRQLLQEEG